MEWTSIIDCAYDCDISGEEDIDGTVDITLQLKDFEGKNLTVKSRVTMYITSDSDGLLTDTVTSASAGSSGIVHQIHSTMSYEIISETDGSAIINLDGSTNESVYMNVVMPNGKIVTSGIITFTS